MLGYLHFRWDSSIVDSKLSLSIFVLCERLIWLMLFVVVIAASDDITFQNVADVIVISSKLPLSKRHTETIDKSRGLKTRHQNTKRARSTKTSCYGNWIESKNQQQQHDVLIKNWQCAVPNWKVVVALRSVFFLFFLVVVFVRWMRLGVYVYGDMVVIIVFCSMVFIDLRDSWYSEFLHWRVIAICWECYSTPLIHCALEISKNVCGQINDKKGIQWTRRRDALNALTLSHSKQIQMCKGAFIIRKHKNETTQKRNEILEKPSFSILNLSIYVIELSAYFSICNAFSLWELHKIP